MSGPNTISAEAIKDYCDMKGIRRDDDLDFLLRMIDLLDSEWIEDWHAREKVKQKQAGSGKKSGKRF